MNAPLILPSAAERPADRKPTVQIRIGDVREQLRAMPDAYFDCVVTSFPYWGLRDYGVAGQIGLEPTLGEHLAVCVEVCREIRRVLKPRGTFWLNYGDCYAAAPNGKSAAAYKADGSDDRTFRDKPFSTVGPIFDPAYAPARGTVRTGDRLTHRDHGGRIVAGGFLKPKDLCMVPNRLAIALQDDGWWVRSEIIWHKPNPMPESVYDRPTSAHEKVWLLTKSEDYFYNHEAIREPVTASPRAPGPQSRQAVDRNPLSRKLKVPGGWDVTAGAHGTINRAGRTAATYVEAVGSARSETRNARNVWTIAPKAYREAHFATFPPALAERCIKAGTPAQTCGLCGQALPHPRCEGLCRFSEPVPGRVLDPFGGAGTVGLVAASLGLDGTLIELNPDYAAMSARRIGAAAEIVGISPLLFDPASLPVAAE